MSDGQPHIPLIQNVKLYLRRAGVELDHTVQWKVTQTYQQPQGFDFDCDKPLVLQRMAERSGRMAQDNEYPSPGTYSSWHETTVGFTEIGEGLRVHIEIALESSKRCRVFVSNASPVVGKDFKGYAVRNLHGPLIDRVKNVARQKGINLDLYGCRVIRIYDNGPEPPGFDFRCDGKKIWDLLAHVKHLERFKFDDPDDKLEGGWFNQVATHGSGYREKGYGPRLHIEIAPRENLGNVHIDSHGFVREDGTYDWHEALTHHGPLDLLSGYVGGRVGRATWLPFGSLIYTRDRGHETTVAGLPDERAPPPDDGGPDKPDRGWRMTFGLRLTF